jgi:hypothetical protein
MVMSRILPRGSAMSVKQQQEHFAGCVYIESMHRAVVADGSILRPQAFKVRYGGFTFSLDAHDGEVTKSAWGAWTRNMVNRPVMAHGIRFDPTLPIGTIITRGGRRLVNTREARQQQDECLLCRRRSERILCEACGRRSAEENRGIVGAISKRRSSPCFHCSEISCGCVIFGRDGIYPLCAYHAVDFKKSDIIRANGFVSYGAIPAVV